MRALILQVLTLTLRNFRLDVIRQLLVAPIAQNEFKAGRYVNAIQLYTRSVERSLSRPPWENTAFTRDEVSSALLNRSAAAGSLGDW